MQQRCKQRKARALTLASAANSGQAHNPWASPQRRRAHATCMLVNIIFKEVGGVQQRCKQRKALTARSSPSVANGASPQSTCIVLKTARACTPACSLLVKIKRGGGMQQRCGKRKAQALTPHQASQTATQAVGIAIKKTARACEPACSLTLQ